MSLTAELRTDLVASLRDLHEKIYAPLFGSLPSMGSLPSTGSSSRVDESTTKSSDMASLPAAAAAAETLGTVLTMRGVTSHTSSYVHNHIHVDSSSSKKDDDEEKKRKQPPSLLGPVLLILGAVPAAMWYFVGQFKLSRNLKKVHTQMGESTDLVTLNAWKAWRKNYMSYYQAKNRSAMSAGAIGALALVNHLCMYGSRFQYPINLGALFIGTVTLGYFCFNYFMREPATEQLALEKVIRLVETS
jgi:hypothetical protein